MSYEKFPHLKSIRQKVHQTITPLDFTPALESLHSIAEHVLSSEEKQYLNAWSNTHGHEQPLSFLYKCLTETGKYRWDGAGGILPAL